MTFLRNILFIYVGGVLIHATTVWLFGTMNVSIQFYHSPVFWIGPLIFIAVGLAIGGIFLLLRRPKNKVTFLSNSAIISCALIYLVIFSFRFFNWYHDRNYANINANKHFVDAYGVYHHQEKIDCALLTKHFENSNKFKITGMSTSKYDSIVNGENDKAYDIGFNYVLIGMKGKFKSKFTVIGENCNMKYVDQAFTAAELRKADSAITESIKIVLADTAKLPLDSAGKPIFGSY